jgi:hypothetical protein
MMSGGSRRHTYLRHGRVAWLVLGDPDEAATAGDLEGAAGAVDLDALS